MYFNREDYGSRIRSLRKKRGLTQEQLAEKMNVSTPYIAKIETGKQTGPVELAVEFAAFFDVSLDYLTSGESYRSLSLKDLNDEQFQLLFDLVTYLRQQNAATSATDEKKKPTAKEAILIARLISEILK